MVNSERDHFDRILAYLTRLWDGGPILAPEGSHLPLRHIYGEDVARAVLRTLEREIAVGRAYNISQDETVSLEEFLTLLSQLAGAPLRLVRLPREELQACGLYPSCLFSPYSEPWMSALDNRLSKRELQLSYTPLLDYLARLVAHFKEVKHTPIGYELRALELSLASQQLRKSPIGAVSSSGSA
jgi:nucleoside-diphosphate-sugar epimerase